MNAVDDARHVLAVINVCRFWVENLLVTQSFFIQKVKCISNRIKPITAAAESITFYVCIFLNHH